MIIEKDRCVEEGLWIMGIENCDQRTICEALINLKELQDFIVNNSTPYFGNLLARIVGVDTIPFLLHTENGLFELMGFHHNKFHEKKNVLLTNFFRIESIDKEACCATISLLIPIDIHGHVTNSICDVMI